MPEYIEREKAKKVLADDYAYAAAGLLDTVPTADVVEVVRCKDCGSYNKRYGECTRTGSHLGENGFCSYGAKNG